MERSLVVPIWRWIWTCLTRAALSCLFTDASGDEWDAESQPAPRTEALADGMGMSWLFTSFASFHLTALMSARHTCRSESTELHVRALSLHHPWYHLFLRWHCAITQ